jgi:hypothetical protein
MTSIVDFESIAKNNILNSEDIDLLRRVEMAVNNEILKVLDYIGIKTDNDLESIQGQMKLMGIRILHCEFPNVPELNGFHILQYKTPLICICDPIIDKDKKSITIHRRILDNGEINA